MLFRSFQRTKSPGAVISSGIYTVWSAYIFQILSWQIPSESQIFKRIHHLRLHFIHPLLGNCHVKHCLFRITMIKQKAFTILFGWILQWNEVGMRHRSFWRSPLIGTLLPLSFSDQPILVSPVFIKDFRLQRPVINHFYVYNRMKNICPELYLCPFGRDFNITVDQL